jgi:tRNA pseudouridine synthase B
MDEILLIDKPPGMTSFGVVARLRRVLSKQEGKKVKVGHTGTLDPFATGLMIIVTGRMCRRAMEFTKLDKWYEAEIILGTESTTGDPEGELSRISGKKPDEGEIRQVLQKFTGKIEQTPPAFSAVKVNGRRAYQLARAGKKVDIPKRTITIYTLELIGYDYPVLKLRTHVSSGTYVRSLVADIGKELKTGAYCQNLRRIKIADYDVKNARVLADFGILS